MWPHHPVASIFRDMTTEEYAELREDIRANGVRVPVVLWRGQLVDGRHRVRACEELSAACPSRSVDCEESELGALVWSLNAQRRQLTLNERALSGAKMANMKQGERTDLRSKDQRLDDVPSRPRLVSQAEAAKIVGVSVPTIVRANAVLKSGDQELIDKVERDEMSVATAAREVYGRAAPSRPKRDDKIVNVMGPGMRALPAVNVNKVRTNALHAIQTQAGILDHYADAALPDEAACNEWASIIAESVKQLRRLQQTINARGRHDEREARGA